MSDKKDYGKLIKILQICTGILILGLMIACIILTKKYNISLKNISAISEMLKGGPVTLAFIIIGFSLVKSFALVFPPAVVFAVCGYMMPSFPIAVLVNVISVFVSMSVPYLLGKFTGKSMVDALSKKFKAVKKIDDFTGENEIKMTFAVKLAGLLPGDLSSLLFGAMNISFKNFTIGANLGMLPLVLAYTFFGTTLRSAAEKPWLVALPVVIVIVFSCISAVIVKRTASKKSK